jgi:methylmalonyl-CoA mutase, N-terminal domain
VNVFEQAEERALEVQQIDETTEREQINSLRRVKSARDDSAVRTALDEVKRSAAGSRNVMPALLEAARARATVGEAMDALADVFGRYAPGGAW